MLKCVHSMQNVRERLKRLAQEEAGTKVIGRWSPSSLIDAENGELTTKDITKRVRLMTRENPKAVFFETRDRALDEAWIHRNYLTK